MSKSLAASLAAALACSVMLTAPALAQTVSGLELQPLPTQLRISVVGKDYETVRGDVRVAARTVCKNARTLGELAVEDFYWCIARSSAKSLRQYRSALATGALASADAAILLSAR